MTTLTRRRKAWAAAATLTAAFGLFLTIGAGSASAAITCIYNGSAGELIVLGDLASDTVTFQRTGGSGGFILVNGATCIDPTIPAAASVLNTDTVYVDLDGSSSTVLPFGNTVVIDNRTGRVTEPGATQTELDLNDIEWVLHDVGILRYEDTNAAGAVTVGQANGTETWDGDATIDTATGNPVGDIGTPSAAAGPCSDGNTLLNLNSFPADNDADVWDCNDQLFAITINGNGGDDFVTGKGGNGTGAPTAIDMVIDGGTGNNEIEGGLGNDTIYANAGDVLNGNANGPIDVFCNQNDTLGQYEPQHSGGDTLVLSHLAGPFTIVLAEDGSITITPAPAIVAVDFENVVGSSGNDTITGNSLSNYLDGGPGNDTIDGKGGNDVIVGGDGDDTLAGGMGNDCVVGNAGNDLLDESAPLNADGTPAYSAAIGYNGSDALDGGPGLDDTISYAARTDRTLVRLGVISWFNDGGDPNADSISEECDDVFFTTENAITGSGNDMLSANFLNNQSDNEFTAGAGNDQVIGGAGNDILHEGTAANGADVFEGDSGSDTADYSGRSNGVNVSLDGAGNDGESGEGDNIDGLATDRGITRCEESSAVRHLQRRGALLARTRASTTRPVAASSATRSRTCRVAPATTSCRVTTTATSSPATPATTPSRVRAALTTCRAATGTTSSPATRATTHSTAAQAPTPVTGRPQA